MKYSIFLLMIVLFSGCTSYKANYLTINNENVENNETKTSYNFTKIQCPANSTKECVLYSLDYITKKADIDDYTHITFLSPYNQFTGFYPKEDVEAFYNVDLFSRKLFVQNSIEFKYVLFKEKPYQYFSFDIEDMKKLVQKTKYPNNDNKLFDVKNFIVVKTLKEAEK